METSMNFLVLVYINLNPLTVSLKTVLINIAFQTSQCSVTCGTGIRVKEPICMRLAPRSPENPHPIKNGTRIDSKFCSHLPMPKYEKSKKVCKSKYPCIHSFRWVVGSWQKVSKYTENIKEN